ncbi:B-cell receptor CD22 [Alligator sinensis]|uniref:B-cell receptor CD22 n=1 Tax=Alligator sinensis TaxID=38654 RepID=A0A3Q0FW61_ALLSI|nr:B-cell receptor CD22 [Alligator sinensis]
MWRLAWALFLPGALGSCQRPVEMPATLLAWPGSCLQIPCRYQACFTPFSNSNPGLVQTLVWYHNPRWDPQTRGYNGMELARIKAAAQPVLASNVSFLGDLKGNCSLLIWDVGVGDNGTYGVWVNASHPQMKTVKPKEERHQRWMEKIEVEVAAGRPTLRLEGSGQLREGALAQLHCSLPHHCPPRPLSLAWGGLEGLRGTRSQSWAQLDIGGAETVARLDLTPQRGDHGHVLTCALDAPGAPVASLKLHVLYPPSNVTLTAMPGPVVTEGQSVRLRCDVLGGANPAISQYRWTRNWEVLEEKSPQLEFTAQVPGSTGTYCCTAQNDEGRDSSPGLNLRVQYAPRAVVVMLETVLPAHAGAPAALLCSCQAEPPAANFHWFREGQELPGQDQAQLQLSPAQPKDAGAYVCQAHNSLGTARSAPFDLVVLYPPEAVWLALEPEGQVLEGTGVRLSCAGGDARPAPTWAWYRDGRPLPLHLPGPMLELSVGPQHRGAYFCEAQNKLGTTRSLPAILDVLFRPREVQVELQAGRRVLAGTPVEMRCAVGSAQPPPTTFTWFLDNATLGPPGPDSALHLPHAHPHHAGHYHCRAENIAGATNSSPCFLSVWYPPQAVRLLAEPGGRLVEGGAAMLHCEAKAWPHPHRYDWYRDGVWLGWGADPAWPLPRLQLQATGTYHCRATNQVGATDGPHLVLTVRKRQQVPNDIVPVVGGQRSFRVKRKKMRDQEGGARLGFRPSGPPGTPDDALNYSEIRFPPGSHDGPAASPRMLRGDTVVYSVLKKPDGPQKAEARGDYENVGPAEEPELHYCSLVLPVRPVRRPDPAWDSDSDSGGSVQYAALRH